MAQLAGVPERIRAVAIPIANRAESGSRAQAGNAVTVTAPSSRVDVRSTLQLTATASDKQGNTIANQSFLWSSSNTNTATVSATGVVSGKRTGTVTITARTAATGGKSGSISIVVD